MVRCQRKGYFLLTGLVIADLITRMDRIANEQCKPSLQSLLTNTLCGCHKEGTRVFPPCITHCLTSHSRSLAVGTSHSAKPISLTLLPFRFAEFRFLSCCFPFSCVVCLSFELFPFLSSCSDFSQVVALSLALFSFLLSCSPFSRVVPISLRLFPLLLRYFPFF